MKTKQLMIGLMLSAGVCAQTFAQSTEEETPMDTLARKVLSMDDEIQTLKKIKVSGYMQGQFQYSDSNGVASYNGGNFDAGSDKRIMLRRARVKIAYKTTSSEYVFNVDATEKGFSIKDMYMKYTLPVLKRTLSITMGNQNRPFGFEIPFSSSLRESPERGRMSQIIFPGERDLGAMLSIQGPKGSLSNMLKLDIGLFNGTGSGSVDFDKQKDVIGRLSFNKSTTNEKMNFSGGVSYYQGAWQHATKKVYSMGVNSKELEAFIVDSVSQKAGGFAKREYMGADIQINIYSKLGLTAIRAEGIQGEQSSEQKKTDTPKAKPTGDVYVRNFNGGYFYLVQNILQTKHQIVLKYDLYDPNTAITGASIGDKNTNLTAADIKYTTIGVGYAYKIDENVKLSAYYDIVKNETTQLKGFSHDVPDNIFTLRMQYKF